MRGKLSLLTDIQFGSTGKGAVMQRMVSQYDYAVRVGAIQAGHTIYVNGNKYPMQSIPCLWHDPNVKLIIGANGMIRKDIFEREVQWIKDAGFETEGRIFIDFACGIMDESHAEREAKKSGVSGRASTFKGVGEATADKARRYLSIARDTEWCLPYLTDTVEMLNNALKLGKRVIIEGTQGAGLSLSTGRWGGNPFYPQCTSREVTPAGLMADVGINPGITKFADIETIGVMRTYPIRIAGDSGPMGKELTWKEITQQSGSPEPIEEITTVTKKVRRVAELDIAWTKEVINYVNPDWIALTFIDYIDYQDHNKNKWEDLTDRTKLFVNNLEEQLGIPIKVLSTGPNPEDWIDVTQRGSGKTEVEMEQTVSGIIRPKRQIDPDNKPVYISRINQE